MSAPDALTPGTLQAELTRTRHLAPDPVSLTLPDGSVRQGKVDYWGSGRYGVEMRIMSEGASSLGLGVTVYVYFPEVGWRHEGDEEWPIRPARISNGTNSGEDRGDVEASIYLLTLAKELRDRLDAEARVALAPQIAYMEAADREREVKREEQRRRCAEIAARLEFFTGAKVRILTETEQRYVGTVTSITEKHLYTKDGDAERSAYFLNIRSLEVKQSNGRYASVSLEVAS